MTQKRVTSVPDARIASRVPLERRGAFEPVAQARSLQELDAALTRALRLPRPEKPPPNVSKCDK